MTGRIESTRYAGRRTDAFGYFGQTTFPPGLHTGGREPTASCPLFQSTLPVKGETRHNLILLSPYMVSIHSPRKGRDPCGDLWVFPITRFQSTLPVKGETMDFLIPQLMRILFQSTLPVKGETIYETNGAAAAQVSIHSPRKGRDLRRNLEAIFPG